MIDAFGAMRRVAQRIRHAPGAERLDLVWHAARGPYRKVLSAARASGVTVRVGGQPLRLHPDFASVSWEQIEPEAYRLFLTHIKAGMTVIDVGGHIGTYSILASRAVGASGRVLAFEPGDRARSYLLQHLVWNDCVHNTSVHEISLGARSGVARYYHLPDEASGQAGFVPVDGHVASDVPVTTLDREIEHCQRVPGLIKIDVEGGEWEVLRGAEATLARHRPTLLLSLHPEALSRQGSSEQQVFAWLRDRGYEPTVFARDHEIHVIARVVEGSSLQTDPVSQRA